MPPSFWRGLAKCDVEQEDVLAHINSIISSIAKRRAVIPTDAISLAAVVIPES
jgi:hypothetical protein